MDKKTFPIWRIIYKNVFWIIISVILFTALFFVFSLGVKKSSYIASKEVMISARLDTKEEQGSTKTVQSATNNATLANLILPTISKALVSPKSIEIINQTAPSGVIVSGGSISFDYSNNSLVCTISYTDENPDEAIKKLDCVLDGFDTWLKESNNKSEKIVWTGVLSLIELQKNAVVSSKSPYLNDAILGAAFGLVIAIVVAVLIYLLDNKVKTSEDIKDITGENVIAYIGNKIKD